MVKKQNSNLILNWLHPPRKRKKSEEENLTPKRQKNNPNDEGVNNTFQQNTTHSFTLKTYDKAWKMEITNATENKIRHINIKNFDENQKNIFCDHYTALQNKVINLDGNRIKITKHYSVYEHIIIFI